MRLGDFKKGLVFFLVSSMPVSILVYYLQHLYLILRTHMPVIAHVQRIPTGDLGILLGVFGGYFFIKYIENLLKKTIQNRFVLACIVSVLTGLICTICELIAGLIYLYFFGIAPWHYEELPYNYKGIVCLEVSLIWIISSFCFYFFIFKYFQWFKTFCDDKIYPDLRHKKKVVILPALFWFLIFLDVIHSWIGMYYFYKDSNNDGKEYFCYPEQRSIAEYLDKEQKEKK
jgi:uncharacterized membrane protein